MTDSEVRGEAEENAAFVLALRERGVRDTDVLRAMERVPRERFVPARHRAQARRDLALPLPCGQTMTAPTVVAAMLTALGVRPGARVLEVGAGSGYATALLLRLGAAHVLSLERYRTLAEDALASLGGESGAVIEIGDGLAGPPRSERFDRILVNGTLAAFPAQLLDALTPQGRLVGALGAAGKCRLTVVERDAGGRVVERLGSPIRVTPLTPGRAEVF